MLLGDIGNRLDIEDTEQDIARLSQRQSRSVKALASKQREIETLQDEVGRLKLATCALTQFLVLNGTVRQEELDEFIREVDAEDGVIDGKISVDRSSRRLRYSKRPDIPDGTFRKADESG